MLTGQISGLYVALLLLCLPSSPANAEVHWRPRDAFDVIRDRMKAVTPDNCARLLPNQLRLPIESIGQIPRPFNDSRNRSWDAWGGLLNLHNQALTRSFVYSYLYQSLNTSRDFKRQPGWLHLYFNAASSVTSGLLKVAASMNAFDYNYTYANWLKDVKFNQTLPLFAPRSCVYGENTTGASRVNLRDEGVFAYGNYSDRSSPLNDWFKLWLPDTNRSQDFLHKQAFNISVMADGQLFNFTIFGPRISKPGSRHATVDPVKFTRPWFDCGESNKWLVSAAAPIVDYVPRYLGWTHLRRHRFVAVSVAEADFYSLDINQCPISRSNPAPNLFANTSRCKNTTVCQPLPGYGFNRGGYQCACKPGYRLPPGQYVPFQGRKIENATKEEYEKGFNCIRIKEIKKITAEFVKNVFKPKARSSSIWGQRRERNAFTTKQIKQSLISKEKRTDNLTVAVRAAVRTSHFLSSLMQNANGSIVNHTREDPLPDEDIICAEVIALAIANAGIQGAGIYYDEYAFRTQDGRSRRFFAPYARFRQPGNVTVRDEGFRNGTYINAPWFADLKMRWKHNGDRVPTFRSNIRVRDNKDGKTDRMYTRSPLYFNAPLDSNGEWFRDSNGTMVYSIPFFGLGDTPDKVEFSGVVKVDVRH